MLRRAAIALTAVALVLVSGRGWGQQTPAAEATKPVVDYTIQATLDPVAKTVDGHLILRYTNTSPDSIPDLRFHLYLNAFKNQRSTFWRESGGKLRDDKAPKDGWGYIDVKTLKIDGQDKTVQMKYIQPDGTDPDDETVARVPLDTPLAPGATTVIECDFHDKMPKVFARTGYHGNYFLIGQWFPKIGVWETKGERGRPEAGWNCHQFHAYSEFYANYGRYKVDITVPGNFVVGATGVQTNKQEMGQKTTYTFEQDHVIDFAWTASPDFIRIERPFKASDEVSKTEIAHYAKLFGITPEQEALKDVTMILLVQPEHRNMVDRYFTALRNGIKYFGLWYGAYPYQTITVVDPPFGADGSGGMEYPTFITGITRRFAPADATGTIPFMGGPEEVTVHEFGHQYWEGMVGNNEFEEAWLDEGFNSYSTGRVMERCYGPSPMYFPVNRLPFPLSAWLGIAPASHLQMARLGVILNGDTDQIVRKAWRFRSGFSYALNSYLKTETALRQLQNELGDDVMARVMRTYFQRWRFRHPSTQDFIDVAQDVSGRDLKWFFDQVVLSPHYLDYAVTKVTSTPEGNELGVFETPKGRITVTPKDIKEKKEQEKSNPTGPHRSTVIVRNDGNIQYPVDIDVEFAGGKKVREHWDGSYRWVRYLYDGKPKIERVVVDPDHKLIIDTNHANNSYVAEPDYEMLVRWGLKMVLWLQNLFHLVAGAVA